MKQPPTAPFWITLETNRRWWQRAKRLAAVELASITEAHDSSEPDRVRFDAADVTFFALRGLVESVKLWTDDWQEWATLSLIESRRFVVPTDIRVIWSAVGLPLPFSHSWVQWTGNEIQLWH